MKNTEVILDEKSLKYCETCDEEYELPEDMIRCLFCGQKTIIDI